METDRSTVTDPIWRESTDSQVDSHHKSLAFVMFDFLVTLKKLLNEPSIFRYFGRRDAQAKLL